jgi:hypothetical protein
MIAIIAMMAVVSVGIAELLVLLRVVVLWDRNAVRLFPKNIFLILTPTLLSVQRFS